MTLLKRIIKTPSIANRTPKGTLILPLYPDITLYKDRLVTAEDRRVFGTFLKALENNIGVPAKTTDYLPLEVGYLLEHDNEFFAVPKSKIRSFLTTYQLTSTQTVNKYDKCIVLEESGAYTYGLGDSTIDNPNNILIYQINPDMEVDVKVRTKEGFYVYIEGYESCKFIAPKGDLKVQSVHIKYPELTPLLDGEIVKVNKYNSYVKE